MQKEISVDLAIIGAGTAGLSAFKEASKVTKNIVIIDHGPLGTTCARVGCMPSKTLLQVADYFYERTYFEKMGITGADQLKIDIKKVMRHVRQLRDYFTAGTVKYLESLGDPFIKGHAELCEPNIIKINQQKIIAKSIIIATGANSIIPEEWQLFPSLLTSENIFEQDFFHEKMAVIGAGPIGLELGQALSRLNIEVSAFHSHEFIGKLTDPIINAAAIKILRDEFSLYVGNNRVSVEKNNGEFLIKNDKQTIATQQILATIGKKSNITDLNIERFGVAVNASGIPLYDDTTMQINLSKIFIAGDVDQDKPLLHEAADEGRIAGYNAVRDKPHCFMRRTPLMITYTQPNIAIVGKSYRSLKEIDFIIGAVNFNDQGRARIQSKNRGILHIYADRENGKLLGAEMIAPAGEHLAHMLAWAVQQNKSVFDILQMPFYHPAVEEGMRTALQEIAKQVIKKQSSFDLVMCHSEAAAQCLC